MNRLLWQGPCVSVITSPVEAVAKYCDAHVCVYVCLSVRQDISGTTRAIFTKFSVHVAYTAVARSCSRVTKSQGEGAVWGVFFSNDNTEGIIRSPITSYSRRDHSVAAAFAVNGIGREGGDGSAQRGRSVIYDCRVQTLSYVNELLTSVTHN